MLEPGKLFVVGDPKQSIYRFRRADIAMYDEVKDLVRSQPGGSGRVEAISQNFRTTPAVLGWVNNVFAGLFDDEQEPGRQPGYQWVEPYRLQADGSRVTVLLGAPYDGTAGIGGGGAARRSTCGRGTSRAPDGRRRRALAGPRARRGIGSGAPPAAALGRCGHPVPHDHRPRDA